MSLRPTVDFLKHDWLNVEGLQSRARFADHSRETIDAVLDTCERIAREKFAPFNRLVDIQEPQFDGEKVILPQAAQDAYDAYAESGMLSAAQDYEMGGMQLPYTVEAAANAFFSMASVSMASVRSVTSMTPSSSCYGSKDPNHSHSPNPAKHLPWHLFSMRRWPGVWASKCWTAAMRCRASIPAPAPSRMWPAMLGSLGAQARGVFGPGP